MAVATLLCAAALLYTVIQPWLRVSLFLRCDWMAAHQLANAVLALLYYYSPLPTYSTTSFPTITLHLTVLSAAVCILYCYNHHHPLLCSLLDMLGTYYMIGKADLVHEVAR